VSIVNEFIFKVLCRVLYSYLYDDETLTIEHKEIVELEPMLVKVYKENPSFKDMLSKDEHLVYLIERFEFFINKGK